MLNRSVSVISISDLHTFNTLNPTDLIVKHMSAWLIKHEPTIIKADVFVIAGDWFDKEVGYSSPMIFHSLALITQIGLLCLKNNIKLRILSGTKSHDMGQLESLMYHLEAVCPTLDVKLYSTIAIETMRDTGLTVLYVPDDVGSAEHVWSEVNKVMNHEGLTEVDMGVMHGCFDYQLPMIKLSTSHNDEAYLRIVKHLITIGHHHVYNPHPSGRIIPQGSADRTAFGQEAEKGGIAMYMFPDQDPYHVFLPNKLATKFTKVRLVGDISKDETAVRKLALSTTELIHIRLVGERSNPLLTAVASLSQEYPHAKFSVERLEESVVKEKEQITTIHVKSVNRNNFADALHEYLGERGVENSQSVVNLLKEFVKDEHSN